MAKVLGIGGIFFKSPIQSRSVNGIHSGLVSPLIRDRVCHLLYFFQAPCPGMVTRSGAHLSPPQLTFRPRKMNSCSISSWITWRKLSIRSKRVVGRLLAILRRVIMVSSAGSWIQMGTRWNCGSRQIHWIRKLISFLHKEELSI